MKFECERSGLALSKGLSRGGGESGDRWGVGRSLPCLHGVPAVVHAVPLPQAACRPPACPNTFAAPMISVKAGLAAFAACVLVFSLLSRPTPKPKSEGPGMLGEVRLAHLVCPAGPPDTPPRNPGAAQPCQRLPGPATRLGNSRAGLPRACQGRHAAQRRPAASLGYRRRYHLRAACLPNLPTPPLPLL